MTNEINTQRASAEKQTDCGATNGIAVQLAKDSDCVVTVSGREHMNINAIFGCSHTRLKYAFWKVVSFLH